MRDIVADAAAARVMKISDATGGSSVEMLPPLWPLVDRWIAACMELFMECCDRAYVVMREAA